jgi:hypothetical protein
LTSGDVVQAVGQAEGTDGFVWWQLVGETWVRSDLVDEAGGCEELPASAPDA